MNLNLPNNNITTFQEDKLKRMKLVSTGLLIFVTILYFIFKKLGFDQSHNLFYSSIIAFCEASMVGALADWFAVVALFKHPLGMSWIPHTAIIKKNKKQIGDSLANFVVDNFFTNENIEDMLENIRFSEHLDSLLRKNKEVIAKKISEKIPDITVQIFKDPNFKNIAVEGIDSIFGKIKLSQTAGMLLDKTVMETGKDTILIKTVIKIILEEIENNKEGIINFMLKQKIMGFISIPVNIAEKIHYDICEFFNNEIQDMDNDVQGVLAKMLLDKLSNFVSDLSNSEEIIIRGEEIKEDFLSSEVYNELKSNNLWNAVENNLLYSLLAGFDKNVELFNKMIMNYIDTILTENLKSEKISKDIDKWTRDTIVGIISKSKESIGDSISKTVHQWPENDIVRKLELQVGSDLQYIRINGTLVGGLFGVIIHLVSQIIR
jgi:uncharacterized membrane-anchored protein YjiN (DUF445 family)